MIELINETSKKASEDYLASGECMNEYILSVALEHKLNEEIIKRICERANQAVYLSLFNNPSVNRKNIEFDTANSDRIAKEVNESESSMQDYDLIPVDYRKGSIPEESVPMEDLGGVINDCIPQIKVASIAVGRRDHGVYAGVLSQLERVMQSEKNNVEKLAAMIRRDTVSMISNNESIADIAKLACRYVRSKGIGHEKLAQVYNEIHDDMLTSGYSVNSEFTKISSAPLDMQSPVFAPSFELAFGLEKIAALGEMIGRVKDTARAYEIATEMLETQLA